MIAIIPGRGGSKGLPKKNIKPLLGKPLIAYTIEAALKAKLISRVIVSTDNEEIAAISKQFGAEVPFMRPAHLSEDDSKAIDVYEHAIRWVENSQNSKVTEFAVLLPTTPLRNENHIDEAIELFYKKNAYSVISYTEEDHPIEWHKKVADDLSFIDIFDENSIDNRQNYQKSFYPNGAIYIFTNKVLETKKYYSQNSFAYLMEKQFSIDIDDSFDFELTSCILKQFKK